MAKSETPPALAARERKISSWPPRARELTGEKIGERYVVCDLIGEGQLGATYDARDLTLGRDVAFKTLLLGNDPTSEPAARLRREARVASVLRDPAVCKVSDLGALDDGTPYIVMERLTGETLADRITAEGALPVDEVIDLMLQTVQALRVAHERGIVHRDVRPEKIFLIRRSEGCAAPIKLLDFGVAKTPDDRDPSPDWTRNGTPYTSPEQALGKPHDARTDIWSCGVVLYEAITGRRPFSAPNYNALIREIADVTPRPVCEVRRDIPRALGTVIERAMAADPARRFQSAAEFTGDLLALGRELADEAPTTPYGNRDLGALELTMTKLSVRLRPE